MLERLILAGLAVSFMFTALTNYLVFAGDQRAAHSVLSGRWAGSGWRDGTMSGWMLWAQAPSLSSDFGTTVGSTLSWPAKIRPLE